MTTHRPGVRRRAALVAAAAALLAGCASASTPLPADDSQFGDFDARSGRFLKGVRAANGPPADTIMVAPAQLFALLAEVYSSLGLAPTVRNDSALVVGASNAVVRRRLAGEPLSRVVDCGMDQFGPYADNYEVHLSVVSVVGSAPNASATIDSRVSAWASPSGVSGNVRCATTGRLEDRIVETVKLRIAAAGAVR